MARQSRFDLVNAALQGTLPDFLNAERAAGRTFDDIAFELRAKDVHVSGETVRLWFLERPDLLSSTPSKAAS